MKKIFELLLLFLFCSQSICAQNLIKKLLQLNQPDKDMILKRDGSEIIAKVNLVTDESTYFKPLDETDAEEMVLDNSEIYMVKFSERGNMFISESNDIFFGEGDGKVPEDATLIYLIKGEEIVAYNVTKSNQVINYSTSAKQLTTTSIPLNDVFVVRYPNTSIEIVNQFKKSVDLDVMDETPTPPDPFVELKEQQPAQEYVIKTKGNLTIRALVVYGNDTFISYYKKGAPQGLLYRMNRDNIKSISKVPNRSPIRGKSNTARQ